MITMKKTILVIACMIALLSCFVNADSGYYSGLGACYGSDTWCGIANDPSARYVVGWDQGVPVQAQISPLYNKNISQGYEYDPIIADFNEDGIVEMIIMDNERLKAYQYIDGWTLVGISDAYNGGLPHTIAIMKLEQDVNPLDVGCSNVDGNYVVFGMEGFLSVASLQNDGTFCNIGNTSVGNYRLNYTTIKCARENTENKEICYVKTQLSADPTIPDPTIGVLLGNFNYDFDTKTFQINYVAETSLANRRMFVPFYGSYYGDMKVGYFAEGGTNNQSGIRVRDVVDDSLFLDLENEDLSYWENDGYGLLNSSGLYNGWIVFNEISNSIFDHIIVAGYKEDSGSLNGYVNVFDLDGVQISGFPVQLTNLGNPVNQTATSYRWHRMGFDIAACDTDEENDILVYNAWSRNIGTGDKCFQTVTCLNEESTQIFYNDITNGAALCTLDGRTVAPVGIDIISDGEERRDYIIDKYVYQLSANPLFILQAHDLSTNGFTQEWGRFIPIEVTGDGIADLIGVGNLDKGVSLLSQENNTADQNNLPNYLFTNYDTCLPVCVNNNITFNPNAIDSEGNSMKFSADCDGDGVFESETGWSTSASNLLITCNFTTVEWRQLNFRLTDFFNQGEYITDTVDVSVSAGGNCFETGEFDSQCVLKTLLVNASNTTNAYGINRSQFPSTGVNDGYQSKSFDWDSTGCNSWTFFRGFCPVWVWFINGMGHLWEKIWVYFAVFLTLVVILSFYLLARKKS